MVRLLNRAAADAAKLDKTEGEVKAVVGKVDDSVETVGWNVEAVQGKVDAMEKKVDNLQADVRELYDMESKLFQVMVGSWVLFGMVFFVLSAMKSTFVFKP